MWKELPRSQRISLRLWAYGAGVLGFGIGIAFAASLQPYAIWLIIAGIVLHGIGMYRVYLEYK